jgi:hypothetical protein
MGMWSELISGVIAWELISGVIAWDVDWKTMFLLDGS